MIGRHEELFKEFVLPIYVRVFVTVIFGILVVLMIRIAIFVLQGT